MGTSAHITSVNALGDFRSGLCTFMHEARDALAALDMEIRRCADWLKEQGHVWKKEVREAEDALARARSELPIAA